MALPPLILRIVADSKGVTAGVASAQKSVGGLRGFVQRNSALMKTAALGGAIAIGAGLKAAFDAGVEAQQAQLKLANSIKNSEKVSKSAEQTFLDQAEALRQLTAVDDEAIVGAQSFLIQMGLTEDQVKTLIPRIVDLSAKMGVDLDTAAKAVGKSVNGTTGGLSRMGVVVEETDKKAGGYKDTLDALGVAQGFAAEKAKTQPWSKLGSELGELAEEIGKALIPVVQFFSRVLLGVVRFLNDHLIPVIRDVIGWVGGKLIAAWNAVKEPVRVVVEFIRNAVATLIGPIQRVVNAVRGPFTTVWNKAKGPASEAIESIKGMLTSLIERIGEVARAWDEFIEDILGDAPTVGEHISDITQTGDAGGPNQTGNPLGDPTGSAVGRRLARFQPSLVGEHGPELFIPSVSGTVVANQNIPDAAPNVFHVYIGDEEVERVVVKAVNRAASRA